MTTHRTSTLLTTGLLLSLVPTAISARPQTQGRAQLGAGDLALLWADVDGDGFEDLFRLDRGAGRLLSNTGDGGFADVTTASGIDTRPGVRGATWQDFDRDGRPDLLQVGDPGANRLWRNVDGQRFEEATRLLRLPSSSRVLEAGWRDYDRDGWADLEMITTSGTRLLRNVGGRSFQTVFAPEPEPPKAAGQAPLLYSGGGFPSGLMALSEDPLPPTTFGSTGMTVTADGEESLTSKTSMSVGRSSLGAAELNGKIHAVGGRFGMSESDVHEQYDPVMNAWSNRAPLPTPRHEHALAAVGGKVYSMGGRKMAVGLSDVDEYDPVMNAWSSRSPLPMQRWRATAAVLDGQIYLVGGDTNGGQTNDVSRYDPGMNAWTSVAPMSMTRLRPGVVAVDGLLYVVGGDNLDSVERYDPGTNMWTTLASMPSAPQGAAVAAVHRNLYVFGGLDNGESDVIYRYDTVANSWTESEVTLGTARHFLAAAAFNERIYVIGGEASATILGVVEEYFPGGRTLFLHRRN